MDDVDDLRGLPVPSMADPDPRVSAVLAVLAGEPLLDVASRHGADPALVTRWLSAFVEAGTAQVTNRPDPEAARQRDRFLAAFLHELRTPLSIALGWSQMATTDQVPPTVAVAYAQRIHDALNRLSERTRDVELLVACSLGRLAPEPSTISVGDLAAGLPGCEKVGGLGAELHLEADPGLVGRILRDLWLEAHREPTPRHVALESDARGPWVELRIVRDADPIPTEVLQALFEPFDLNDDASGITIGLYLARALTVAHGGTLGVEQDDDRAVFWVRLPAASTTVTPITRRTP